MIVILKSLSRKTENFRQRPSANKRKVKLDLVPHVLDSVTGPTDKIMQEFIPIVFEPSARRRPHARCRRLAHVCAHLHLLSMGIYGTLTRAKHDQFKNLAEPCIPTFLPLLYLI